MECNFDEIVRKMSMYYRLVVKKYLKTVHFCYSGSFVIKMVRSKKDVINITKTGWLKQRSTSEISCYHKILMKLEENIVGCL